MIIRHMLGMSVLGVTLAMTRCAEQWSHTYTASTQINHHSEDF